MKKTGTYEDVLKGRYLRLYGERDHGDKIRKAQKTLITEVVIAVLIFIVITGNDIVTMRNEYSNVIINNRGEITGVVRPDASEGKYSFTTKVKIISDEREREKEFYITIEPAGEKESAAGNQMEEIISNEDRADNQLKRLISKLNADTTATDVVLPQNLESGEELIWMKAENTDPVIYFMGLLGALFLIYHNRFYAISREEKMAKESIIKELPEFINKLVLLINAGVILNTAFLKVVEDCDERTIASSYFYSRIVDIGQMVRETNASFHHEMYSFAKNSGVKELMRITNIMMDNISKGDDLSEKLKRENELLWFARKQQAEEKGKLAETKLTLPLMILLTVLIVVTISPALMEI